MADRLILLEQDGGHRSQEIIDAFAERTGLEREEIDGGACFLVKGTEHELRVVHLLDEIDPAWSEHIALGEPHAR